MNGAEIKERRQALGLTQPDVVKALRKQGYMPVDVSLLSKIESGYVLPAPECDALLKTILQAAESGNSAEAVQEHTPEDDAATEDKRALDAARRLSEIIPYGRQNAIKREDLAAKLGLPDRLARRQIELARRGGLFIIAEQRGQGYYITNDTKEMTRQFWQDTHRALSILARRKPLRDALKERGVELEK